MKHNFYDKYPDARVMLPRTLIITTDCFDEFMEVTAETVSETQYARHVRFLKPLYIFVDGRNNKAVVKAHNN